MKSKILELLKTDHRAMMDLIIQEAKNPALPALFQNKDFFLELYLNLYRNNKDPFILQGIQVLVAHGLLTCPNIEETLAAMHLDCQEYCDLSNIFDNRVSADKAIEATILLMDSKQLQAYIDYLHTYFSPDPAIFSRLEQYKNYLITVAKHQQAGTLSTFFQNEINNNMQLINYGEVSRTHLDPYLSECSCADFPREIRQQLELRILQQVTANYPPHTTEKLHYLSLGSGQLLQDFIILMQLLKAGYKNIEVAIVEPALSAGAKTQFASMVSIAAELNAKITLNYYPYIGDYAKASNNQPVDVINGIDFENALKSDVFSDVIQAHSLLQDRGFFLLSFTKYKLTLTKTSVSPLLLQDEVEPTNIAFFNHIKADAAMNKQQPTMAMLGQNCIWEQWLYLLPMLRQAPFTKLTLLLEKPPKVNYSFGANTAHNQGFTEENLSHFLSLCLAGKSVAVHFIENPQDIDIEQKNLVDVATWILIEEDAETLYNKMHLLKNQFKHANTYITGVYTKGDIPIFVANGDETTWVPKEQTLQTINTLTAVLADRNALLNVINDLLESFPEQNTKSCLPFFATKPMKQHSRIEQAVVRAYNHLTQYLSSTTKYTQKTCIKDFLIQKINNQESIYEACGNKVFGMHMKESSLQKALSIFFQDKYHEPLIAPANSSSVSAYGTNQFFSSYLGEQEKSSPLKPQDFFTGFVV